MEEVRKYKRRDMPGDGYVTSDLIASGKKYHPYREKRECREQSI